MVHKRKKEQKEVRLNTYIWSGLNKRSEKVSGEINAPNIGIAKAELRRHQIVINKVRKKPAPLFARNKKITSVHIATFTRQLAVMVKAGIPIVTALDILGRGHTNQSMRTMLLSIKADIETGLTVAQALRKQPKFFNDLYCNLVDSGEVSGHLEVMLDRLATYREKAESMRRKVKKAIMYPIAIIIVAIIVTTILLVFVVPQFDALFKDFGAQLPALTRLVVHLSNIIQEYWWVVTLVFGAGGWLFVSTLHRSPRFRAWVDKRSLRIPIIGQILEKSSIARFARTLAITTAAGMPLVEALDSAAGATNNHVFRSALDKVRKDVATGQQLAWSLRMTKLYPNMVIEMVNIGEESGQLEEMLSKVADFFEEEVDTLVESLSSLLEPAIMVILGVLVGGLVVAMYLPIFELGSVIK